MKFLSLSFLLVFIFAPLRGEAQTLENMDWSELFPEFPGCERTIQPLVRTGEVVEQTAVYKPQSPENTNPPVYYGCGRVTLRFMPSARKSAAAAYLAQGGTPFFRRRKIKTFDAYTVTPRCGNDFSRGSVSVYFGEDKVLIVHARRGVGDLLKFAETADYVFLGKSIDEFIKRKIDVGAIR